VEESEVLDLRYMDRLGFYSNRVLINAMTFLVHIFDLRRRQRRGHGLESDFPGSSGGAA
jgi:hypothetical protein